MASSLQLVSAVEYRVSVFSSPAVPELLVLVEVHAITVLLLLVRDHLVTVLRVSFSLEHHVGVSKHVLAVHNFKLGDQLEYLGSIILHRAYWIPSYLDVF